MMVLAVRLVEFRSRVVEFPHASELVAKYFTPPEGPGRCATERERVVTW